VELEERVEVETEPLDGIFRGTELWVSGRPPRLLSVFHFDSSRLKYLPHPHHTSLSEAISRDVKLEEYEKIREDLSWRSGLPRTKQKETPSKRQALDKD